MLRKAREGIQYVEHAEDHGDKLFAAVCNLGLEGIVSKRITSVYKSGPSKTWIKVKNPEGAGSNSHHRWDFLIAGLLAGAAVSLTRQVLTDAISGGEASAKTNK